jgi:uncharacterized protein YlbG (UPF0298 family)
MKKIKSFIYLDNEKMYSISSQIFNGLTEYIVKTKKEKEVENTQQKGEFGSGRLMADIIESESNQSEKRFLHHSAYNLFEDELVKENKILDINLNNIDESILKLSEYDFIKVTNKIAFSDATLIKDTFSRFNEMGVAITYVQHNSELDEANTAIKNMLDSTKDRNQKNKIQSLTKKFNVAEIAKEKGLFLDPKFIESLTKVIDYGYKDSFHVQIPFITDTSYHLFSSLLSRNLLTESENSIITKYSRETEKEFTVFGLITQIKKSSEKISLYKKSLDDIEDELENSSNMKEAIMKIVSAVTNIENTFSGKLDYEYIIDPIAIYREI